MQKVRNIFQKIGSGLLYGIGIGISVSIINSLMVPYLWPHNLYDTNAEKNLVITEHRDIKRNNNIYIFGTLENQTKEKQHSFKINADFFDVNGTFIEQCHLYISTFPSSKTYNFKISCNNCNKKTPIEYSSYKVYITN